MRRRRHRVLVRCGMPDEGTDGERIYSEASSYSSRALLLPARLQWSNASSCDEQASPAWQ
uniref:Uncharacterized protein n=1 Tax=Oryza sativa subsp. japonica TaxID=39947 RepID=Q6YPC9_ORYSJ|nr:hypothetical protein [Oryza sativa Japonica Group]